MGVLKDTVNAVHTVLNNSIAGSLSTIQKIYIAPDITHITEFENNLPAIMIGDVSEDEVDVGSNLYSEIECDCQVLIFTKIASNAENVLTGAGGIVELSEIVMNLIDNDLADEFDKIGGVRTRSGSTDLFKPNILVKQISIDFTLYGVVIGGR